MMAIVPSLSSLRRTMRARQTCFCGLFGSETTVSRRRRSSEVSVNETPGRILQTSVIDKSEEHNNGYICNDQPTSVHRRRSRGRVSEWQHTRSIACVRLVLRCGRSAPCARPRSCSRFIIDHMIAFCHADPGSPFLRENSSQSAGRWNAASALTRYFCEPFMHMAPVARVCHQMLRLRLERGSG